MLSAVDNVSNNCRCGRKFACTRTVEAYVADSVASYKDSVENILDACKLRTVINYGRAYKSGNFIIVNIFDLTEKFNYSACIFNVRYILKCNVCDSFGFNLIWINVLAKSKGSSNPHNLVKATIGALCELRDAHSIARVRGISMDKVFNG